MAATDDGDRRFGDREVSLILKRVVELQRAGPDEVARRDGLSLADLEQIAGEAGLDPSLVRRAAAELESGVGRRHLFLGAPTRLRRERVLPWAVPEAALGGMVDEIRWTFGQRGDVTRVGRTLGWTATWKPPGSGVARSATVSIAIGEGRTVLQAEESIGELAGALFGGLMGGLGGGGIGPALGIGLGALGSLAAATGIWAVFAGGSYALARAIYTHRAARHARELDALLDRLAEHARPSALPSAPEGALPPG